jgi:hypothetical protein
MDENPCHNIPDTNVPKPVPGGSVHVMVANTGQYKILIAKEFNKPGAYKG